MNQKTSSLPARHLTEEKRGKAGHIVTRYQYDSDNRLIRAETPNGTTQYRYDALGRRILKHTAHGETRFQYDGPRLLAEIDSQRSRTYLFEPGSFRPLALHEQDNTQASGIIYHYHLDHLGTPRELTDSQGKIVWSARYRAYGNLALADVEAIDNPLRFQGQYFDQETGLHYNLNRYYDPNAGRFVHQDPIGLEGGNNLYQYAPNPIDWVDPFGLTCKQHLDVALKRQGYKSGDQYPSGFKEKWSENGYDYEVRIHGPDSKAPLGSNSAIGTTYRVARRAQGLNANGQGSGWEYGDAAGNWYPTSFLKTAPVNPAANVAASATHIPIPLTPIP